jgi:preprotein translocase subunit SecA
MNQQREVIYRYRDDVLEGRDMGPVAREEIAKVIDRLVDEYTVTDYFEDWDLEELWVQLDQIFQVDFGPEELDPATTDRQQLKQLLIDDAHKLYEERENDLTPEIMRQLERFLLLQIIDERWREHLFDMDYLREGIHLRGFAQIEPIVAYKNEAFTLFTDMMNGIWGTFARMVYNVEVEVESAQDLQTGGQASATAALEYSGGTRDDGSGVYGDDGADGDGDGGQLVGSPVAQRRLDANEQLGRNDPCWCGSGKKFKKCHGA